MTRSFSDAYYNALDTVGREYQRARFLCPYSGPIPNEQPIDNFTRSAAEFQDDLEYWAKGNPLRIGQHIAAYEDSSHSVFIAYGVVTARVWNDFNTAWQYEIQKAHSNLRLTAWGFHCRTATPEEIRLSFVKIDGACPC
jgi:hypothetical protein